ncbi:hypothetical protein HK405_002106, partial [Cladochytrium tenue]
MTQPRPVMRRNKGLEVANSPRYPNNVDKPFMVNLVKKVVMAGPRPRFVIVLGSPGAEAAEADPTAPQRVVVPYFGEVDDIEALELALDATHVEGGSGSDGSADSQLALKTKTESAQSVATAAEAAAAATHAAGDAALAAAAERMRRA